MLLSLVNILNLYWIFHYKLLSAECSYKFADEICHDLVSGSNDIQFSVSENIYFFVLVERGKFLEIYQKRNI